MNAEELIRKWEDITLRSEEDNMINFKERMKVNGKKLVAHCLVEKFLRTCSVHREGLLATMQQAWRTTKEIKENFGRQRFHLQVRFRK